MAFASRKQINDRFRMGESYGSSNLLYSEHKVEIGNAIAQ